MINNQELEDQKFEATVRTFVDMAVYRLGFETVCDAVAHAVRSQIQRVEDDLDQGDANFKNTVDWIDAMKDMAETIEAKLAPLRVEGEAQ